MYFCTIKLLFSKLKTVSNGSIKAGNAAKRKMLRHAKDRFYKSKYNWAQICHLLFLSKKKSKMYICILYQVSTKWKIQEV